MNTEIQNEDEFQAYLMKSYPNIFTPDSFPKVYQIAGRTISPEIDLLVIDSRNDIIAGYEFKFLSYKTSDANYKRIREGIGQALLYFQFGVDRSYLVLGVSKKVLQFHPLNIANRIDELANLRQLLEDVYKFDCLGLLIWMEGETREKEIFRVYHPKGKFSVYHYKEYELNRKCLLDMRFKFGRKYWTNHIITPYLEKILSEKKKLKGNQ